MKPTRNIVKPNTGMWKPTRSVWFQKNSDYQEYRGWSIKYKKPGLGTVRLLHQGKNFKISAGGSGRKTYAAETLEDAKETIDTLPELDKWGKVKND